MSNLTPKQTRFVQEFLIDLNATQAAIRAGYSKKTARQVASENLSKPDIQRAIEEAQQTRAERTELTQDGVVQGLLKEAEFTGEGSSPAARVSAWAHLGRHLGMFKDKISVGGNLTVEVVRFASDGHSLVKSG